MRTLHICSKGYCALAELNDNEDSEMYINL